MNNPLFSSKLLLLPLFQGFSRLDFIDIVGKVPFDFKTFKPNETIVSQGDTCQSLYMLIDGEVQVVTENAEQTYRLTEQSHAPWVIQMENLFGLHNRYTRSVYAKTETHVAIISKQSVREMLMMYPAFQINFYNSLSTLTQRFAMLQWQKRCERVEDRFRVFLLRRSLRPSGCKDLHIHMENLAAELGTTRLRVSSMLAEMASKKLLTYSRGIIHIVALEHM